MFSAFSHLLSDPLFNEKLLLLKLSCYPFNMSLSEEVNLLAKDVKDWEKFLAMASLNAVAPVCFKNIDILKNINGIDRVKNYLGNERLKIIFKNTLKLTIMKEVVRLLENANIKFIAIKGYQFIKRYYGDVDLREIGDIDLLMSKDDCMRAAELLRKSDYDELRMPYVHHIIFFSRKYKVQIELHYDLIAPPHCFRYDLNEFCNNVIDYKDEEFSFKVLSDPYELYMLLISTLFAHSFMPFKARNIIDLYVLLTKLNKENIWEYIMRDVVKIKAFNYLLVSIKICHDLFKLEIPDIFISYISEKSFIKKYKVFTQYLFHYIEFYRDLKHGKNAAMLQIKLADNKMDSWKLFYNYIILPKEYILYSRDKLKVPILIFYLMRFFQLPYRYIYKSAHSFLNRMRRKMRLFI
jgi:hypothetical protein